MNSNTYIGASGGAFGCWVDCEKTQILQTCNEQSGIPGYWDISGFFEILKTISKDFQELVTVSESLKTIIIEDCTEPSRLH